jgi:hypothetical protein|tara:strand:+ start:516 stop:656 length:141 start_codon:yes stop_codon:yes gene_type:complete
MFCSSVAFRRGSTGMVKESRAKHLAVAKEMEKLLKVIAYSNVYFLI